MGSIRIGVKLMEHSDWCQANGAWPPGRVVGYQLGLIILGSYLPKNKWFAGRVLTCGNYFINISYTHAIFVYFN